MKTLHEFLLEDGKINHKAIDEFALYVTKHPIRGYVLPNEAKISLYRITSLLLYWEAKQLLPDEITWKSFFTVLWHEVCDKDYRDKSYHKTTFDVLMEEAGEKDATIYTMHQYYCDSVELMPDDAMDVIRIAVGKACYLHDIEFNEDELVLFIEEYAKKQEELKGKKEAEKMDDLELVRKILACLNTLKSDEFKFGYIEEAWEVVKDIKDDGLRGDLNEFLIDYEEFNEVHKAVYDYAVNL